MKDIKYLGYYPGVVGKIIESHAVYYYENWGFDVTFETQVGEELSQFIHAFKPSRDVFWVALKNKTFAGAIALDGKEADTEGARIRWFIVPQPFQGLGIGSMLLKKAVEFCMDQKEIKNLFLWTFEGLDQARLLYEREGFRLLEQHDVDQWGGAIREQKLNKCVSSPVLLGVGPS